jgi:hypothetical protein
MWVILVGFYETAKKNHQAASQTQDYTVGRKDNKCVHVKWKYMVAYNRAMMTFI